MIRRSPVIAPALLARMRRALLLAFLSVTPLQAQTPRRVVSLHPAATEILLELGAADLLVARTEGGLSGVRPARGAVGANPLAALPSLGRMLTPDLEVLASVEPDLVIAWAGADLSALTRVVERRGGRVEAIGADRLRDVPLAIERIGGWVGRADAADRLSYAFQATLARAGAHQVVDRPRPRVLWVVWSEPVMVAGPDTFVHDVIEIAGGENAAVSIAAPWPRLGMESLVALDPDVVVWPDGPGLFGAEELPARRGWRSLRAVESGRILVVDAERYHDAGPEIAEAALDFARDLERMMNHGR